MYFDTLTPEKQLNIGRRAMQLLYELTPGGSEFVCEPEACHTYVKQRLDNLWKRVFELTKQQRVKDELEGKV